MKNTLGDNVRLTLWGESHGKCIGAVLDGVCPGIEVNEEFIKEQLNKRRPKGKNETQRVEEDNFIIASGVFNGYTTGEAISIIIENNNVRSKDYDSMKNLARPSHADYVAYEKYHGFNDYRGGGHFSGRITAAIVAACAILIKALEKKNIYIGTHIKKCGDIVDKDFNLDCKEEIKALNKKSYPVLNDIEAEITNAIDQVRLENDSIGGILQSAIVGLPVGLGDPWFSSVEGKLSLGMFAIGGVKGVEFGLGFDFATKTGINANDEFYVEKGNIKTKTNNNAGVNGGITNGMPVLFNLAVKPTPSISLKQNTVDFVNKENKELEIVGRHDPAIIRRMAVVVDSVAALVVCDLLASRYGNDFLNFEEK